MLLWLVMNRVQDVNGGFMVAVKSLYGVLHCWSLSSADYQRVPVLSVSESTFMQEIIRLYDSSIVISI